MNGPADKRAFIRRVLRGDAVERLPRAVFGGGRWAWKQTGLELSSLDGNPRKFGETLGRFFAELDTDIVFAGSGLNTFPAEAIGGEIAFREGQAPLLSAPVIRNTDDARFLQQFALKDSPRTLALVDMVRSLRETLPDRFLCATSWGPFTWAMILCEWNMLQDRVATDREFIVEICRLGVRLTSAFFELLAHERLVDGIVISDGAATLVPLDLYRDTVLPAERSLFDRFAERGIARFLHQCGSIGQQFDLYPASGADCISLDAGIVLSEACRRYRGRVVTAGNVDVVRTVFGGNPDEICRAVAACVSGIPSPFRKFILMPSCDLPPETPIENVRAFLACADTVSA